MYEQTYDIIDWKSCASCSECQSSTNKNNSNNSGSKDSKKKNNKKNDNNSIGINKSIKNSNNEKHGECLPHKASDGSNASDIVFPCLFYEGNETETSIVTLTDNASDCWPSETIHDVIPDDMEQLTVYQKVANWVSTQKVFFRKEEVPVLEDDDLEVIDPVDLFDETVLDDYLLVTEDDSERRIILRELNDVHYDIGSVAELMQTYEYTFIREPKGELQLEMDRIIEFGKPMSDVDDVRMVSRKKSSSTHAFPDPEEAEDKIHFLGVPRILQNYVILDREGYVVNLENVPDLWLSPFEESLNKDNEHGMSNQSELEFHSSWFSEPYQTDCSDSQRRRPTFMTDMMEKLTVISVDSDDDDDVWEDAPEIPYWLDEEPEELELFNQPSRPLYYYRDRIKGCYRIIGVEDETVVLFSGNDDDTIFYSEENTFNQNLNDANKCDNVSNVKKAAPYDPTSSFVSKYRRIYNRLRYGKKEPFELSDTKNDSGIDEDIDEAACYESIVPFSLPGEETKGYTSVVTSSQSKSRYMIRRSKDTFVEYLLVITGACIVVLTLALYENGSPFFQVCWNNIVGDGS